jgi:hypothetical protein
MHHATEVRATAVELQQLRDARYACQQAAAALASLGTGAANALLQSEVAHLRAVLMGAGDALGSLLTAVRLDP